MESGWEDAEGGFEREEAGGAGAQAGGFGVEGGDAAFGVGDVGCDGGAADGVGVEAAGGFAVAELEEFDLADESGFVGLGGVVFESAG